MDTKERTGTLQLVPEPEDVLLDDRGSSGHRDGDPGPSKGAAEGSSGLCVTTDSSAVAALVQRTRQTIADAVPANTRRAYAGDLRRFAEWCTSAGLPAMPAAPGTIAVYMRVRADAGRLASTIERDLAAICTAHVHAGHPSPWGQPIVAGMLDEAPAPSAPTPR
jgi:hypothetical protein